MTLQSSVSWVDYSESDRRKMIEIVSLFKDRETRDELGLGSIRDAFADLLFPGTSTIQTRVHYFLFVPWIYRQLEEKRIPAKDFGSRLWRAESILINTLKEDKISSGIIGQRVGASLNRFPSNIYWSGLNRWGIGRFPGTQSQYHRSIDAFYKRRDSRPEKESPELVENRPHNWDPILPPVPKDFPNKASFHLSIEQAEYLMERLLLSCSESLLAHLVIQGKPVEGVSFAWHHPQFGEFPTILKNWLTHARNFSEALNGAALLYNLMLAEHTKNQEWISNYQNRLAKWREDLLLRKPEWAIWDRWEFWNLVTRVAHVPLPTQRFVNNWLDGLLRGNAIKDPTHDQELRDLIVERETWLKRSRSRFSNRRHLELWPGEAGTGQFDFRWATGRDHTNEILRGLGAENREDDAHPR